MTGQILTNGTDTFKPIINRLLEIAGEFVPYFIYIAIGALGISLLWRAVKTIVGYLINVNKTAFYTYRDDWTIKNGNLQIIRTWKKRKKIKWKYFRHFR